MFASLALTVVSTAATGPLPDLDATPEQIVYAARTALDFDSTELRARPVRPEIAVIGEPQRPGFTPLIRLRADFRDTIDTSTAGVR